MKYGYGSESAPTPKARPEPGPEQYEGLALNHFFDIAKRLHGHKTDSELATELDQQTQSNTPQAAYYGRPIPQAEDWSTLASKHDLTLVLAYGLTSQELAHLHGVRLLLAECARRKQMDSWKDDTVGTFITPELHDMIDWNPKEPRRWVGGTLITFSMFLAAAIVLALVAGCTPTSTPATDSQLAPTESVRPPCHIRGCRAYKDELAATATKGNQRANSAKAKFVHDPFVDSEYDLHKLVFYAGDNCDTGCMSRFEDSGTGYDDRKKSLLVGNQ